MEGEGGFWFWRFGYCSWNATPNGGCNLIPECSLSPSEGVLPYLLLPTTNFVKLEILSNHTVEKPLMRKFESIVDGIDHPRRETIQCLTHCVFHHEPHHWACLAQHDHEDIATWFRHCLHRHPFWLPVVGIVTCLLVDHPVEGGAGQVAGPAQRVAVQPCRGRVEPVLADQHRPVEAARGQLDGRDVVTVEPFVRKAGIARQPEGAAAGDGLLPTGCEIGQRRGPLSASGPGLRPALSGRRMRGARWGPPRGLERGRVGGAHRHRSLDYRSISRRRGSSSASLTRTRKVTAPLPSTMRWS